MLMKSKLFAIKIREDFMAFMCVLGRYKYCKNLTQSEILTFVTLAKRRFLKKSFLKKHFANKRFLIYKILCGNFRRKNRRLLW